MGIAMPPAPSAASEQLLARLAEEKTVDALNRLLDRLEVITFVADALDGFLARANVVAESVAESVADMRKLAGDGTPTGNVIDRIPSLARAGVQLADVADTPAFQRLVTSGLLEKLGDDKTIDSIKQVLDRLELASFTLEAIDGFLRRSNEISHALSDDVEDLRIATQPDVLKFKEVLEALPPLITAGQTLMKSGMLEPRTVAVLGQVGRSAAQSFDEAQGNGKDARPIGILGLLGALKDPDVNRAISFGLRVAKSYGQSLDKAK